MPVKLAEDTSHLKLDSKYNRTTVSGMEAKIDLILNKMNTLSADTAAEVKKQMDKAEQAIRTSIVEQVIKPRDEAWGSEITRLKERLTFLETREEEQM